MYQQKIEEERKQFKSKLNEITTGNPKTKSKEQLYTITNIKNFYNSREKVVKLYNDYTKSISEAMYKANQGTGLKILTPKQIVQVRAGGNSENLLHEIRQIAYYLYQSKEITKKVYSNIIKSIQI